MAKRLLESWDGLAYADLPGKWDTVVLGTALGSANGRTNNGLRLLGDTSPGGTNEAYCRKTFDQQATWVVGWALRKGGNPPAGDDWDVLRIMDGTTKQLRLVLQNDGILKVLTAGSAYVSVPVQPTGSWLYLELKATIHNSAGAFELRVNGEPILTRGSIDTRDAGSSLDSANRIELVGVMGQNTDLDDIYVNDGTGSRNNDFNNDTRVYVQRPESDGALKQWTPSAGTDHYLLVDEPTPNGDTDGVQGGSAGLVELFGMSALPAGVTQIHAIQPVIVAKKTDAGVRSLASVVRQDGVNYAGTERFLSTSYLPYPEPLDVNPATGNPFTVAELNGLAQFGFTIVQ